MHRRVVGLVSPRYAPAIGGVERHVEMLARGLVERGIIVEVLTTDPTGQLPHIEFLDGILVRRFSTLMHDDVFYLSPGLARWLWLEAGRYHILHGHSYHTPLLLVAAAAACRARIPFVCTLHYHGTGHTAFRRVLHIPYRPLGHWAVRQACRVFCVSDHERTLVRHDFGLEDTAVIASNGVEIGEFLMCEPAKRKPDELIVFSAGRLVSYKQVDRLVAALPLLPAVWRLVVDGKGPAAVELINLADKLKVSTQFCLLGGIPRRELVSHYRSADVFVSLSRMEAFGLTILEAAVGGAAIVASDIPAHREVARYLPPGRIQFVSPDCSPAELAEAIELAKQASHTARDVQDWPLPTWHGMVDGILAEYDAILDGGLLG